MAGSSSAINGSGKPYFTRDLSLRGGKRALRSGTEVVPQVYTRALTSPLQLGLLVLSAGAVGTSLNLGKVVARGLGSGVEVAFAAELS